MMERVVDIRDKYQVELSSISNILKQLKENRIYNLTGVRMDGSLSHHIQRLTDELVDLINKIEYGKISDLEKMHDAVNKLNGMFD